MKFSRQSRLLKPAEFKQVFQQPIRSGDDCFRVLARVNGIKRHRVGLAISKKFCAKAVGRNRIKRIVRESFRARMAGIETDQTLDFVVMSTIATTNQVNSALFESLSSHWKRLVVKAENRVSGMRQEKQRIQK